MEFIIYLLDHYELKKHADLDLFKLCKFYISYDMVF